MNVKSKVERPAGEIRREAEAVLRAHRMWRLPVDPFAIAAEEEIELAPGRYGPTFDGRIRYIREIDTFVLAYQELGPGENEGRVRFTVAHELGHYFLHRDYLLSGECHGSKPDFRSSDQMEREADEFAANLLMPKDLFVTKVKDFRMSVCDLKDLCKLAGEHLKTSITSTARRYCQLDIEACSVVFSENGRVRWAVHSGDMQYSGMGYIPFGEPVPIDSVTARVWNSQAGAMTLEIQKGRTCPHVWYSTARFQKNLWEEAMPLGRTGIVLTLLVPDEPIE